MLFFAFVYFANAPFLLLFPGDYERLTDRRRNMRREDPRRHTLGGDMLTYVNQQNQMQQQKSMDLEVSSGNKLSKRKLFKLYVKKLLKCLNRSGAGNL